MRRVVLVCLVALGACNGHRYGFLGDEDGASEGGGSTTGPGTTLTPTSAPPPGTTIPDPTSPEPTSPEPTTDPTLPDPTTTDPTSPEPTTTTGPSTLTDSSDPSTTLETGDPTGLPGCNEVQLESLVPQSVFASNFGNPDLFALACNTPGAGEAVFAWRAPFTATFRFDTVGSSFDTVLGVLGDLCGGPELGCNDDFNGLASAIELEVAEGQFLTLVIEGLGGAEGELVLNISQVVPPQSCELVDLGTVSEGGGFFGSTVGFSDLRFGTCGGDGAPEQVFLWTAPHSGTFQFHAAGVDFDPVIYVREACDGSQLACNDDFDGLSAQVELSRGPEDGSIFLFVDGAGTQAGVFDLKITEI